MNDEKKIDTDRYPSNSYNKIPLQKGGEQKAPEKKPAERVTKGHVVQKKKTLGAKFAETFLAVDLGSVCKHIMFDVLIPTTKETLEDIIRGSTSMILWGDDRSSRSSRNRSDGRVYRSYDQMYDDRNRKTGSRREDDRATPKSQSDNRMNELVFDREYDAKKVRDSLFDRISEYGVASVKDFYRLSGMPSDWAQETVGWFNLEDNEILRVREGWLLRLPRPVRIDE